jgi:hypothetical protein
MDELVYIGHLTYHKVKFKAAAFMSFHVDIFISSMLIFSYRLCIKIYQLKPHHFFK